MQPAYRSKSSSPIPITKSPSLGSSSPLNRSLSASSPTFTPKDDTIQFQYKIEDRNRTLLKALNIIIDSVGTPHPRCKNISTPCLNHKGLKRYSDHLIKTFSIICEDFDLENELLSVSNLIHGVCQTGYFGVYNKDKKLIRFSFEKGKFIGSGALQIAGVEFVREVVRLSAEVSNCDLDAETLKTLLQKLFNADAVHILDMSLNGRLADLDIRLMIKENITDEDLVVFIDSLVAVIGKTFTKPFSTEKRRRALNLLNSFSEHPKPESFLDDPNFEIIFIRNMVFHKLFPYSDAYTKYAIGSFGDNKLLRELMFVKRLARDEMFPSIEIPIHLHKFVKDIKPEGNIVQAVIDLLCGWVRPNLEPVEIEGKKVVFANEFDLKALITKHTKGKTNPVVGSTLELLKILRKSSSDSSNSTYRKIFKDHSKLIESVQTDIYPLFWMVLMKDVVEFHLFNDPHSALALTFNTVRVMKADASEKEINKFILLMKPLFSNLPKDHLTYSIAQILCDTSTPLELRLAPLQVLSFLNCQADRLKENDNHPLIIFPREDEKKPIFEINLKLPEGHLSLMCDGAHQSDALDNLLKYIRSVQDPEIHLALENLIHEMLPTTYYLGSNKSPMLGDLRFFSYSLHKMVLASEECLRSKNKSERLLGLMLALSSHAITDNKLSTQQLLVTLPQLIIDIKPQKQEVLATSICYLLPEQINRSFYPLLMELFKETDFKQLLLKWCIYNSTQQVFTREVLEVWNSQVSRSDDNELKKEYALIFLKNTHIHGRVTDAFTILSHCITNKFFKSAIALMWISTVTEFLRLTTTPEQHVTKLAEVIESYLFISESPDVVSEEREDTQKLSSSLSLDNTKWICSQLIQAKYPDLTWKFLTYLIKQKIVPCPEEFITQGLAILTEQEGLDRKITFFFDAHSLKVWNPYSNPTVLSLIEKWIPQLMEIDLRDTAKKLLDLIPVNNLTEELKSQARRLNPPPIATPPALPTLVHPPMTAKVNSKPKRTPRLVHRKVEEVVVPKSTYSQVVSAYKPPVPQPQPQPPKQVIPQVDPQHELDRRLEGVKPILSRNIDSGIGTLLEIIRTTNPAYYGSFQPILTSTAKQLITSHQIDKCLTFVKKKEVKHVYEKDPSQYIELICSVLDNFDEKLALDNYKCYADFLELLLQLYKEYTKEKSTNTYHVSFATHLVRITLPSYPKHFISHLNVEIPSLFTKLRKPELDYNHLKFTHFLLKNAFLKGIDKADYIFVVSTLNRLLLQQHLTSEVYQIIHFVINQLYNNPEHSNLISTDIWTDIFAAMALKSTDFNSMYNYLIKMKSQNAFVHKHHTNVLFTCMRTLLEQGDEENVLKLCSLCPKSLSVFMPEWEKIYLKLILNLIEKKQWSTALETLHDCPLSITPSSADSYYACALKLLTHLVETEALTLNLLPFALEILKKYKIDSILLWSKIFTVAANHKSEEISRKMWEALLATLKEENNITLSGVKEKTYERMWLLTAKAISEAPFGDIMHIFLDQPEKLKRICLGTIHKDSYAFFYTSLFIGFHQIYKKLKTEEQVSKLPVFYTRHDAWKEFLASIETAKKIMIEMHVIDFLSDLTDAALYPQIIDRFYALVESDAKASETAGYVKLKDLPEDKLGAKKFRQIVTKLLEQSHKRPYEAAKTFKTLDLLIQLHLELQLPVVNLLKFISLYIRFFQINKTEDSSLEIEIRPSQFQSGLNILDEFLKEKQTIPTQELNKLKKHSVFEFLLVAVEFGLHHHLYKCSDFIANPRITNLMSNKQHSVLASNCVIKVFEDSLVGEFLPRRIEAINIFKKHIALISTISDSHTKCTHFLSRIVIEFSIYHHMPNYIVENWSDLLPLYGDETKRIKVDNVEINDTFLFSLLNSISMVLGKSHLDEIQLNKTFAFLNSLQTWASKLLPALAQVRRLTKKEEGILLLYLGALISQEVNISQYIKKETDIFTWSIPGTNSFFQKALDLVALLNEYKLLSLDTEHMEMFIMIELNISQRLVPLLNYLPQEKTLELLANVINRYLHLIETTHSHLPFEILIHLIGNSMPFLMKDRSLLKDLLRQMYKAIPLCKHTPSAQTSCFEKLNQLSDKVIAFKIICPDIAIDIKSSRLGNLSLCAIEPAKQIDAFFEVHNYCFDEALAEKKYHALEPATALRLVFTELVMINHISQLYEKPNPLNIVPRIESMQDIFFYLCSINAILFVSLQEEYLNQINIYIRMMSHRISMKRKFELKIDQERFVKVNVERVFTLLNRLTPDTAELHQKRADMLKDWILFLVGMADTKACCLTEAVSLLDQATTADIFNAFGKKKTDPKKEPPVITELRALIFKKMGISVLKYNKKS